MFAVGKSHVRWCAGRGQMVIGKECSPGRGPHFARCHTDESPGHLLSSQTSQSRQLAALSDWTARKHLTRSARRADRRCPQPFVDGSSLPPAGQDDPGPGVRRPNPGSGCPAGTARATPRAASRPTRRRPKPPEPSPPGCAPVLRRPENRNSPRHRPTGKSPSLSPGHWSAGARAQGPFSVGRPASTPGWAPPIGHDARSNRTSAPPSLSAWTPKYHAAKAFSTRVRNPHGTPAGNPPCRARRSRRH